MAAQSPDFPLIQNRLRRLGLYPAAPYPIDDKWGAGMRRGIGEALAILEREQGIAVAAQTRALANPLAFYDALRAGNVLGPVLSQVEVDGCNAIVAACVDARWPIADTAYALATAYHETAGTMQPIREYGRGKGRRYGVPGKHGGQIAYGRGYVQLTWPDNYERADRELGLGGRLIANYDLALDPKIAASIMIRGMAEGWFTGRDLDDDLPRDGPATLAQFIASRDIINGTDKAAMIGDYAVHFQGALQAGGYQ